MFRTVFFLTLAIGLVMSAELSGQTSDQLSKQVAQPNAPKTEAGDVYQIKVKKGNEDLGTIEFVLWPDVAPKHCAFFAQRVAEGWYNGSAFHRVIPNFMIQGGDPNSKDKPRESWGQGGFPEHVVAEFNARKHERGVLSAARTQDPNSFSGQFFICVADAPWLDGSYSAFGKVTKGLDVVDAIVALPRDARDNPLEKVTMTIVKMGK